MIPGRGRSDPREGEESSQGGLSDPMEGEDTQNHLENHLIIILRFFRAFRIIDISQRDL